jgi:heat shock protein HslJ
MFLLLLLLVAGACAGQGEDVDIVGNWRLTSGTVDGKVIALDGRRQVTMTADATTVGGTSACNSYGGSYTVVGSAITITDLVTTEMACEPDVMETESAFQSALGKVDTVRMEGGALVFTGEGVELRYAAA